MFIELCFSFVSIFVYLSLMWSVTFPCLTFSLSCAILSQSGLLEVPVTYLRSFGYFLARGLVLLHGCTSEKLMLMGDPECAGYLASLTLPAEYWGPG
jgi:hypothetical protein